jgi:hypothetical protein
MKMRLRRSETPATASTAAFSAVLEHLAAGRAAKEQLEPAAVRERVVQDPLQALRERLAGA